MFGYQLKAFHYFSCQYYDRCYTSCLHGAVVSNTSCNLNMWVCTLQSRKALDLVSLWNSQLCRCACFDWYVGPVGSIGVIHVWTWTACIEFCCWGSDEHSQMHSRISFCFTCIIAIDHIHCQSLIAAGTTMSIKALCQLLTKWASNDRPVQFINWSLSCNTRTCNTSLHITLVWNAYLYQFCWAPLSPTGYVVQVVEHEVHAHS